MKLETLKMAGALAIIGSGLAAPASASDKALLDTLVSNGTITQQQADEIERDSAVVARPNRNTISDFKIRGRVQGQFAASEGSNDNSTAVAEDYNTFEFRRVRLGVQGKVLEDWDFLVEINALSSVDLDSATLAYNFGDENSVIFGKAKPQFGFEENTSSASILTIERSVLTNYFQGGKPVGLRLEGGANRFSYYAGVYNGASESTSRQGAGADSFLYNASGELNFDDLVAEGVELRFRADYLKSSEEGAYYRFDDAIAVSGHVAAGDFDFRAEFMKGEDHSGRDVDGFYVMPSYYLVPKKWQLVTRYETVEGDPGVNLGHQRYASNVPGIFRSGNEYDSVYAGLNYYISGDNLKLMLGVDRGSNKNSLTGEEGTATTFATGIRMQY